jgi:hypothetical protein
MNKIYIVSRIGWQYDDDNYYCTDDNSGKPIIGFSTLERANAECLIRNIDAYRELSKDLGRYGDYRDHLIEMVANGKSEEFERVCKAFDIYDEMEIQHLDTLTDRQLAALIPTLDIQLYQVDEIEYEEDIEDNGDFVG